MWVSYSGQKLAKGRGGGGGEFGGPYGVYSLIAHVLDTSQVRDFV